MKFDTFLQSESGAVTVDYVFWLTASVWSTTAMLTVPTNGIENIATDMASDLRSGTIMFSSFDELSNPDRVLTTAVTAAADLGAPAEDDGGSQPSGEQGNVVDSGNGGPQGNNGWGNGDQDAPGNSGPNNNAENGGGSPPPGQSGGGNGNSGGNGNGNGGNGNGNGGNGNGNGNGN